MLQLRLLGTLALTRDDGSPIRSVLAQPKRAALLAYLAASRPDGPKSRDTLLALFWPESDDERARNALKQSVFYLRRSLGEEVIESTGMGISVSGTHLWCDATVFVQACERGEWEEALTLYRGHFLEGFHVDGAPALEEWMVGKRQHLRALAAEAAWRLAETTEIGDRPGALCWARRAVELAPNEEEGIRRLVTMLDRAGDRAGALAAYTAFAQRLATEIEVEPSPETQAVIEEIRTRDEPNHVVVSVAADMRDATAGFSSKDGRTVHARGWAPLARYRRLWAVAGLVGIAAAVAAAVLFTPAKSRSELVPQRVLVATLQNRTGDPTLDVVGSMAADWIAQGLQQTGLVEVIDPATAFFNTGGLVDDSLQPKGPERVYAAAEATRSGIVVWGAYYRRGDSLHFHIQITDATTSKVLRTLEPLTAPVTDPIAGVQGLRQHVAGALAITHDERLASLSSPSSAPPTFEAYQAYTAGLDLFIRRQYREAVFHFGRAASLDSTFMLPKFWMLFSLGNSGQWAKRDSMISALIPVRERLLPLDQHSLDYFIMTRAGDQPGALVAARAAAKLAPQSNWTFLVAVLSSTLGYPREALSTLLQLDPERGWIQGWDQYWDLRSTTRHLLGQHEQELAEIRHARSRDLSSPRLLVREIVALATLGRLTEIIPLHTQLFEILRTQPSPRPDYLLWAGADLRAHGHPRKADIIFRRTINLMNSLPPEERNTSAWRYARAAALYHGGRWREAEAVYVALAKEEPDRMEFRGYLGAIAARRGDRAEAERAVRIIEKWQLQQTKAPYVPSYRGLPIADAYYQRARIAALLGNREQAVLLTRLAVAEGLHRLTLMHSIDMESLRSYPPFRDLLRPLD